MTNYHPWTRVPHYLSDLISHFSFIAVDLAVGTNRFQVMERTFGNLPMSVFDNTYAVWADAFLSFVMCMTVHRDH